MQGIRSRTMQSDTALVAVMERAAGNKVAAARAVLHAMPMHRVAAELLELTHAIKLHIYKP